MTGLGTEEVVVTKGGSAEIVLEGRVETDGDQILVRTSESVINLADMLRHHPTSCVRIGVRLDEQGQPVSWRYWEKARIAITIENIPTTYTLRKLDDDAGLR